MKNWEGWGEGGGAVRVSLEEAKVLCILYHRDIQLIFASSLAGLLSLQQVRVEGVCFFFPSVSSLSFLFLFLPCPSLSSPLLLFLFSLSMGNDTKWPTRVDVSFNPNTINQK